MPPDLVAFDGFDVRVDLDRWPAKILRALLRRHYERNERHLLRRLLRPGDTVVELGSAIGVVALAAARIVGPDRVHGFDANPDMVAESRANFALNRVPVSIANRVLCAGEPTAPEVTFHKTPYFLSSSLARHRDDMEAVSVPVAPLEATLEACGANTLVIDIEGGEFDLLSEARLEPIERLSLELHLAHGDVGACLELIGVIERQGLGLDADNTSENVIVFARGAAAPPGFARAYLLGLDALRTGERAQAGRALDEARGIAPANASVHIQLADLLGQSGDLDGALVASGRARAADPHNADALEQSADLLARQGRFDAAVEMFREAETRDPWRPLFAAGLGSVCVRMGDAEAARAAFARAALMVPERAHGFSMLVSLAARRDKFDADRESRPPTQLDAPARRRMLARLAALVGARFKLAQAGAALAAAMRLCPDDEAMHVALAHLTATPNDLREALQASPNS